MKWILVVIFNLMVSTGFAQECSWVGIGEELREEVKKQLIQKAKEKLDFFLLQKGIIRTWEGTWEVEVKSPYDYTTVSAAMRFHYFFKTQKGSEISTDPLKSTTRENYFHGMKIELNIQRDPEGYPLKKSCLIVFMTSNLPLFNKSFDDYFIGQIEVFDPNYYMSFNFPINPSVD